MTEEAVAKPKKEKKKKKFGAGKVILLIIAVVIVVGAAMFFRVPQKIGIVKSPAEKLFAGTPDREAAAAVLADFQAAGLDTRGVEVYVLSVTDTGRNVAMVVLDESKGFDISHYRGDPVLEFMKTMAGAKSEGIDRAAVAYFDQEGKQLASVTVPTDIIVSYAQGKATDRQLMEQVDIGIEDVTALVDLVKTQIN